MVIVMKNEYKNYREITKELLDGIKVGDLIKVNEWKKPLRVRAVSKNYFVMATRMFGKWNYSVCEKLPWDGIRHNEMRGGLFHVGVDAWIFGSPSWCDFNDGGTYDFDNKEASQAYIDTFELQKDEVGHSFISPRGAVPIYQISIKTA